MRALIAVGLMGLFACTGPRQATDESADDRATAQEAPADAHDAFHESSGEVIYGRDLRAANETDLAQAIVTRVPGAHIVYVQGEAQLRIRGTSTIYGNPNPLLVLDGMTMSQTGLSVLRSINVQTIDRVEVLKRTNETALYGVQGTGGVIRVWTRRGLSNETP